MRWGDTRTVICCFCVSITVKTALNNCNSVEVNLFCWLKWTVTANILTDIYWINCVEKAVRCILDIWDWTCRAACVGGKCFLSGATWSWMCWLKLRGERYSHHYQLHEASSCPHSACDWYIVLAALKTMFYAEEYHLFLVTDIYFDIFCIDWYICYKLSLYTLAETVDLQGYCFSLFRIKINIVNYTNSCKNSIYSTYCWWCPQWQGNISKMV